APLGLGAGRRRKGVGCQWGVGPKEADGGYRLGGAGGAAAEGRGRDRAAVDCRWRGQADADEEVKPKGPVGRPRRARVRIAARITRARFVNQSRIDAPEKDTPSPRSA